MYLAQAALNNLLFPILESQGHGDRVPKNPDTITINLKKIATVPQRYDVAMFSVTLSQYHYYLDLPISSKSVISWSSFVT